MSQDFGAVDADLVETDQRRGKEDDLMAINRRRVPVAHIKILARVWRGCKGGTGAIGEPNKSTGPAPGDSALKAVDAAPDGKWIAASEWEVRDIFQKLTADCFGEMIQRRIDHLPSASQAAFSPDARSRAHTEHGPPLRAGADPGAPGRN
jgi:hypothetical protein